MCLAPVYARNQIWLKNVNQSSASNYTANYEPFDPCLKSAVICTFRFSFFQNSIEVLSPEHTKHGRMPVCPNTPLDGETTARVYVVRSGKF